MKRKLTMLLAVAMLLTGCSNEGEQEHTTENITLPSQETEQTEEITETTPSTHETEETTVTQPAETVPDSTYGTTEPIVSTTDQNHEESSSGTTTQPPSDEPVELTPDPDSGDTLLTALDSTVIGKMQYYTAYAGAVQAEPFSLTSYAYIKEMTRMLNGMVYVEQTADELLAEEQAYREWQQENDGEIQPETLAVLDKKGNEIIRFYSDARAVSADNAIALPFSRVFFNGRHYRLFYGEPDYSAIQEILLNQQFISEGFFFLEVYENVAKNAAPDQLALLADTEPTYRVHSPDEAMISSDGTILYPDSFPKGTTLVDCIFAYPDGGTLTVTMNATDAEVYQIKIQH